VAEEIPNPNPNSKRTQRAREVFAERFASPEERTAFYRELGRHSAQGRIILSGEAAAALRDAYALLRSIAPKLAEPDEAA
jgi:hypothetical protein